LAERVLGKNEASGPIPDKGSQEKGGKYYASKRRK